MLPLSYGSGMCVAGSVNGAPCAGWDWAKQKPAEDAGVHVSSLWPSWFQMPFSHLLSQLLPFFAGDGEHVILNPSMTAVTPAHPHSDASPISATFGTQSLTGPNTSHALCHFVTLVAIIFSHFLVAKEPLPTRQHHSWPLLLSSFSPSVPR